MTIAEMIASWRAQADQAGANAADSAEMSQARAAYRAEAATLRDCADQLEKWWQQI